MPTKSILFAIIIAACGVTSGAMLDPPEQPPAPPNDEIQKGQHFCCMSFDGWVGEGCSPITEVHINSCDNVLYCPGKWKKEDGAVICE